MNNRAPPSNQLTLGDIVVNCMAKMELLRLSSVCIVVVLATVSSVEAGVTPFEEPFLPAGMYIPHVTLAIDNILM